MFVSGDFWLDTVQALLRNLWGVAPLLALIFLAGGFLTRWIGFRRQEVINKKDFTLFEIKTPREVHKSPLAMEIILDALFQAGGETTWIDRYIYGKVRTWFSLEIVSIEGAIHFFVWGERRYKDIISAAVYAQYPSAEVYEVPDYTASVAYEYGTEAWDMFGAEFKLTKPDPYPIKTYVEYGLDKQYRVEEEKVDPLTSLLETLGSIGRGEQLWLQFLIRANKGKDDPTFAPWQRRDWRAEGERIIDDLLQRESGSHLPKVAGGAQDSQEGFLIRTIPSLTQYERDLATAIQRSIEKNGFDSGLRMVYMARKNAYNGDRISMVRGAMRPFSTQTLNGLKPTNTTDFDWPWQPYFGWDNHQAIPTISLSGKRLDSLKWKMFDAFRRRSYFLPPYQRKPFVLNTEELATLYHLPGVYAETPTFSRVESKKAEPPTDLPM